MKPMNRKTAFTVLGVVSAVIMITILVMGGIVRMSNVATAVSFFSVLFLTFTGVVFILYKYPGMPWESKNENEIEIDMITVTRTREGTVLEAFTGLLVVVAWVSALVTGFFIGEDGGILYEKIFELFMFTVIIAFLLIDVYTPSELKLVGKLTNAKQIYLGVRMNRILAILCALLLVLVVIPSLYINRLIIWHLVLMVGIYIYFRYLIYKSK